MNNPADPLRLPDRFSLVRKLGQGGMGVVYEVLDRERQTRVALKTLLNLQPLALYRFKNEFRTLANFAHPNLIPLYELISDGQTWFFTMELVEGVDFLSFVRPRASKELQDSSDDDLTKTQDLQPQAFRERALRDALRQLAEGVNTLHAAGILHRDLKPSNVIVREDGELLLLDFGLAKEFATGAKEHDRGGRQPRADQNVLLTGPHVVGSVGYMSPEQATGSALTEASDWYAVGVMVYEALTGVRPYVGNASDVLLSKQIEDPIPPGERSVRVPDDLGALAMALLQRDPRHRPSGRDVMAILAPDREMRRPRISASTRAMPFVGRERHMDALQSALDDLHRSRAVTVEVHGRSGAGKTTLMQQFLTSLARQTNVVVLAGRCYEQESVPFKALDSLVDALCQYLLSLPALDASLLMPRDVRALARLFPVLERVDAVRQASRGQRDIPDVQEIRRRGVRALGELLQRLGDRQLLVLSIDDLQWGDVDSAALIAGLLQSSDPPRLLLLAAYRSEYVDRSECLQMITAARAPQTEALAWREVEVAPLSFEESSALATELLGAAASGDPDRVARVAVESRGNPYFVYELVREVQQEPAGVVADSAPRKLELDEVLWRRVCGLPDDAVQLLQVVALAGKPLEQRHAFGVAASAQPRQAVALLRAERLVRTTGPGLSDEIETYHDRIRESTLAHLAPDVAQRHHLRLAESLETSGASDLEWIASLFRQAGEQARAGVHYLAAADKAAEALAFPRSAVLYALSLQMRPLEGAEARTVLTKMGDALANAGRGFEAAQAYERACEGADETDRIELERRAGYQYCVSGHIDEGRRAFGVVLAHSGQTLQPTRRRALASLLFRRLRLELRGTRFTERSPREIAQAVLDRVDVSWSVAAGITIFDPIRGADFQTQNLLLALRAGEPYRVARALAWEAAHIGMVGVGLKKRAEAQLEAADALATRLDHPHATGMVKMSRGVAAYFHGEFEPCQRYSDEAVSLFRDHCTGVAWELETSNAFAYWSLYFRGEYAELTRRSRVLLAEVRERGARMAEADLVTFGGPFVWLAADDPDGAAQAVDRVMGEWSQQDFQVQHFTTLTAQAQIAIYAGRYEEAWARINDQWAGVKDAMLLYVELVNVYMLHLRARAAIAALDSALDPAPLLRSAGRDAARLERLRPAHARALAKPIRAALAHRAGKTPAALALLAAGSRELRDLGWGAFSVPAERCLGLLMGDDAGRRLAADAEAALLAQGVRNVDRLTDLQMPGFVRP